MTKEQVLNHAIDRAIEAVNGPRTDTSVRASIAKHLDVVTEPCALCGTERQRVVVVGANGSPRTRVGGSGQRPMEVGELVAELRAADRTW